MELKGKKIYFLGDSITEGVGASDAEHCYVSVFGKLSGAIVIRWIPMRTLSLFSAEPTISDTGTQSSARLNPAILTPFTAQCTFCVKSSSTAFQMQTSCS